MATTNLIRTATHCEQQPHMTLFQCPLSVPNFLRPSVPSAPWVRSSNKIILMDEVQNLLQPSPDIQKSKQRVLMLDRLKSMLATAKNSVLVGFTATPLVGDEQIVRPLLDLIKGQGRESLSNEGFVSYFMSTPASVFPLVQPPNVPAKVPTELIKSVELKDLPPEEGKGNLAAYLAEHECGDTTKMADRCSVGQYYAKAGQYKDGPINVLKGDSGSLLKRPFGQDADFDVGSRQVPEGYCRLLTFTHCARYSRIFTPRARVHQ
jgi:hypothetical protein